MMNEKKRFDVVVVGELNPDLILSGEVRPEFGQVEKLVSQASLVIGSSSAIFACGAAKLGLRVAFVGKVGDDLFGSFMCQSLEERGIDIVGVVRDVENPSGISVILSEGNDRAILTYPGTIPLLGYSDINLDILRQSRHLHVGSYYIQEGLRSDLPRLFDHAHEYGMTVSLDTNYDPRETWQDGIEELLSKVEVFLPNSTECRAITGIPDLDKAADVLAKKVKYLGVKLGAQGARLYAGGEKFTQTALPMQVIDTVGAGDSFDAGFICGYMAGWDAPRILKLATICGSLSTRKAGGTTAQPSLEEAMGYL